MVVKFKRKLRSMRSALIVFAPGEEPSGWVICQRNSEYVFTEKQARYLNQRRLWVMLCDSDGNFMTGSVYRNTRRLRRELRRAAEAWRQMLWAHKRRFGEPPIFAA